MADTNAILKRHLKALTIKKLAERGIVREAVKEYEGPGQVGYTRIDKLRKLWEPTLTALGEARDDFKTAEKELLEEGSKDEAANFTDMRTKVLDAIKAIEIAARYFGEF